MKDLPEKLFIAGTDTGIGKTVVSAILVSGLKAAYWKPVQSGLEDATDSELVRSLSGAGGGKIFPERYRLNRPLSPHQSARHDGVTISLSDFELPKTAPGERLVVEGAGGLLVPLNERDLIVDLIRHLALPVVLVAKSGLGTINHTLQSLEALRARGINIVGVVVNGELNQANCESIAHFGKVEILAQIPRLPLACLSAAHQRDVIENTYGCCFGNRREEELKA